MMPPIPIRAGGFPSFGPSENANFYVVVDPGRSVDVNLIAHPGCRDQAVVEWDLDLPFDRLLLGTRIPEPAHVLVISPQRLFRSPPDAVVGRRKLMVLACGSTPTGWDEIAFFLSVAEHTDPEEQERRISRFLEVAQASDHLEIIDQNNETRATFDHTNDAYDWNQQAGALGWGEQQIVPSGELSITPGDIMQFELERRLSVNGTITLSGPAIVHGGTAAYSRSEQQSIHDALATLEDGAVVATVEDGMIRSLEDVGQSSAHRAAAMLEHLFDVDQRYRIVQEIGFGLNSAFQPRAGNVGMNEPCGGSNGILHWGLGLTPSTQYALTFLCPDSRLTGRGGSVLVGARPLHSALMPRKVSSCPCRE
jgi:hypothetical protein